MKHLLWRLIRIGEYPIWIIYGTFFGYRDNDYNIWQRFVNSHKWWWHLVKTLNF